MANKLQYIREIILTACLLCSLSVSAQWVPDVSRKVKELSTADRLSINANGVDWLLLVPNIGIEYDIANNKNYNRWAVDLDMRYKWKTGHTYIPGIVYNIFEIKTEVRNYWRTRALDGKTISAHKHIWDKAVSLRRKNTRHPITTYYRGFYLSYGTYSLRLVQGELGHQGKALSAGVVYGIQRPVYRFQNGRSIDFDLGIAVGAAYVQDFKYSHNDESNTYVMKTSPDKWKIMPMVNDIRAGLVLRLGKTQGYDKYRFRYDVDMEYREKVDSIIQAKNDIRTIDSIKLAQFKESYKYYTQQLDSIIQAHPEMKKTDAQQRREQMAIEETKVKEAKVAKLNKIKEEKIAKLNDIKSQKKKKERPQQTEEKAAEEKIPKDKSLEENASQEEIVSEEKAVEEKRAEEKKEEPVVEQMTEDRKEEKDENSSENK